MSLLCWVYGVKFSHGKIFLGDGGAYALGHLLVWSAIILINGATEVNAFAILLVFSGRWQYRFGYLAPVEVGKPTDRPDRLHFHQLAMRFLEIRFFGRKEEKLPISSNSDTHPFDFNTSNFGVLLLG